MNNLWREKSFQLSNGLRMPCIGLGTFRIKGQESIEAAIKSSLKDCGYRLIDTAAVYKNEALIASALDKLGISRKDVFITSKLAPRDQGQEKATLAVEKSLENLRSSYIDLYLIHWPGVQGLKVDNTAAQSSYLR